jgi:hypothetical protein
MFQIPYSTHRNDRVHQEGQAYMEWNEQNQTCFVDGKFYILANRAGYEHAKNFDPSSRHLYRAPVRYYRVAGQGDDEIIVIFRVYNAFKEIIYKDFNMKLYNLEQQMTALCV